MVFHVMSKGNGGQEIFLDGADWREFLAILSQIKARNAFDLFAYCLMPNHFHLLVRVGVFPISLVMQHLLTRYSKFFNFRNRRRGHLFQGRFKALSCDQDAYFLELVRYIHLNPVRAGLVGAPGDWPWSGHHEYVSSSEHRLIDPAFPLSLFGDGAADPVRGYLDFIRVRQDARDSAISARLASTAEEGAADEYAEPDFDEGKLFEVAAAICEGMAVPIADLRGISRRPEVSRARHSLIRKSTALGFRPSQIAAFINRSPSAVSKVINER